MLNEDFVARLDVCEKAVSFFFPFVTVAPFDDMIFELCVVHIDINNEGIQIVQELWRDVHAIFGSLELLEPRRYHGTEILKTFHTIQHRKGREH